MTYSENLTLKTHWEGERDGNESKNSWLCYEVSQKPSRALIMHLSMSSQWGEEYFSFSKFSAPTIAFLAF